MNDKEEIAYLKQRVNDLQKIIRLLETKPPLPAYYPPPSIGDLNKGPYTPRFTSGFLQAGGHSTSATTTIFNKTATARRGPEAAST